MAYEKHAAAVAQLRTLYPKSVKVAPSDRSGLLVLKEASENAKLAGGKRERFERGPWKGMRLYSLTLEERATCPMTCPLLANCYGDNMPFAARYRPGEELHTAIERDIMRLAHRHPEGFVVRLHVLGDFHSIEYVDHWHSMLVSYPELHIFGYTHRQFGTEIGDAVTDLVHNWPGRVSVLRSDPTAPNDPLPAAVVVEKGSDQPAASTQVICPEQTGKTEGCLTCGLCTNGRTAVTFINHSRRALPVAA